MKLNRKNKQKNNCSIKRPASNNKKNLNLMPLFIQITKKNMIYSQNKEEESSLINKKKNSNMSNSNNNNNNNNNMHSSSSLYINYNSPANNVNINSNNKNKSKKESLANESIKNNMILTSVDNSSSLIGSKEKILSYNQNNNRKKKDIQYYHKKNESINIFNAGGGIGVKKKNSKNKKYPLTSLNSRKNSVDKKKSNKSSLKKYQQFNNKKSVNLNSNRNKNFQSTNVNTCSNKNLLNNNSRISFGFSCFNNYIKNAKLQKNQKIWKKKNKVISQNITHFFNNNKGRKFQNKSIINMGKNPSQTAKVSPRTSFMNTNSKSSKAFNSNKNLKEESRDFINIIKNKSKINEIFKSINIGKIHKKNNFNIIDISKNTNSKNRNKSNTNYNSFNNFYNNFILNNNCNNTNNNNNYCNNLENLLNNCQTTSGAFYNNYNININNQINNHIIYNNNNSRKKVNNMNFLNSKIKGIISQSQHEILQIKKNINKHFTSNNSPNKILNYKIVSCKKTKNNPNNLKKNNFFLLFNNFYNESNKNSKNKLKNNLYNKGTKKFRNIEKNKKSTKVKSKSTEKLNMQFQIKSLKSELMNENNNSGKKSIKVNENKIKSCGKLDMHTNKGDELNQNNNINLEIIKKNIFMEDSLNLTNYIKNYYKNNHEYPMTTLDFYKYGRLIGQGAFGKVNLGLNVLTGRVVAIKSFNKKNLDSPNNENMKKIIYETNLMRKLNHPNITKILEMFEDEKYILIIMEYINGGNLFSFVKKRRKLNEKISKFLFKQIILGIKHIHSQNIVHRDVKLENILIDLNNTIKICDFGIGRILSSPDELLHDQCGTPMYMAPEILSCSKEKGYKGFPVDIWSAGIALYIMLSGTLPFSIKNDIDSFVDENNIKKKKNMALRHAIIHNEPKKIEKISDKARDLLHGLLNKDPTKRLSCDEILNHPWLNSDDINNQHHLFTKAEMIMLSKTYIDYRKANMDELQENFTISNLKRDKIKNTDKNVTTKSFILTPYNSLICDEDSNEEEIEKYNYSEFDDLNNENINLENEIISFNNKVKEYNMLYELNNNNEVDNGMLINTKINSSAATFSITNGIINNNSVVKTESVFCVEEEGNKDDCDEDGGCNKKVLIKNKQIKNQDKEDTLKEKNINKIFDKIEALGYDKKYVQKCLENNILCHATSIYFLLMNYDNI